MALLDTTIVTVALPTIRTGLHASSATLLWVVSAYALAYGLSLVPAFRAATSSATSRCSSSAWPSSRWPVWPAGCRRTRARSSPPVRSRASEPGYSTRPSPRPSSCRSPGRAVEGVRRPRRHDRRVHRGQAGARRPDHRERRRPRRLALGVPGEPVHRRRRIAEATRLLPRAQSRAAAQFDPAGCCCCRPGCSCCSSRWLRVSRRAGPPGATRASAAARPCSRCSRSGRCAPSGAATTRCCSRAC